MTESELLLEPEPNGKFGVRIFLSYARVNRAEKTDLLERLEPRFGISRKYVFDVWQDERVQVGEAWPEQIRAALMDAHLGILLLTPEFLASTFITTEELPAFIETDGVARPGRRVVPVALKPVDLVNVDLRGLEERQIYRDVQGRAYSQCTGPRKDAWVDGLVNQLYAVLSRYARGG